MDFFIQKIYKKEYAALCERNNVHPAALPLSYMSLYQFHKEWVMNPFMSKKVFETILIRAKRVRFTLRRFFVSQLMRKKNSCNSEDMSMTPLGDIKKSLVFHIRENGKKYTFLVADLINIIKQALTFNTDIHPSPKQVVNPYTRTIFRKETLYLFFLKIYESKFIMPILLQRFATVDFDLKYFAMQNESVLREYAIKSTVESLSPTVARAEIRDFFDIIRVYELTTATYQPIMPNARMLPNSELLQFKPWLHAYYVHSYSLNPTYKNRTYKKLIQSMMRFTTDNPCFGMVKNHIIQTEVNHKIPPFKHELCY